MLKSFGMAGAGFILFCLLFGPAIVLLLDFSRVQPPDSALPMLVRDLPHETSEVEPAFRQRVHSRFPDGGPSAELVAELRREGFFLREDRKHHLEIAVLERKDPICTRDWIIHWTPDAQARAQNIGAHFNLGCL
jgi:hypothetical protein